MKKKQTKWLDNFGKADNANESNVSLPDNFNGLSYDTSYRDYSPAWGGQFQDGGYIPIAQKGLTQQDATRVDNNAADRIWGIQRELDAEKLSRDDFKEKYGMPLHQFKMRDSSYASAFQRQLEQRRQQDPNYAEVNLPSTDIRSSIYQGNPNLAFLPGTSKGQSRAALEDAFLATTTLSAPLLPVNTAKIGQFSKIVGDYLTTQTPLKNIYKLKFPGLNKNSEDFFSKYLTPKEAAVARAERMLAQEPKWQVNNNSYTRDKFENINNNFEEVYAHEVGQSPKSLGINMEGKSLVFKDSGLSPANQARVAAHETGHFYRNMADEANEWNSFFDFSNLKQSTRRYLRGKSEAKPNIKTQSEGFGFEKGPPHGDEIRERAAQLKDYIAQKNRIPLNKDFTITEKQLNDAIKNYVKDTGLDNTMTEMLNSLKDKKGFLRAMNKYALGVTPATVIGAGATQLENEEQSEQFQQGGSIPGTVGFTYARTGSTPSEGKYAKKTLPSALNGKEMKFYQEGLDWKPKSMQNGGVERISTSDPRYPQLYKNRQVGAYYDGAFTLPDLDEVTVTAPRSYTMQSLRDAASAALYGAPANVMKLSSVPQAAMTEGIEMLRGKPYDFSNVNPNFGSFTSNQRDPSMTMGYENPEGFLQNAANIGLSMIDPIMFVGAKGTLKQPVKQGLRKVDVQKSGFPNPLRVMDSVIPRPLAPGNLFGLEDSWNNYSPLNLIPGYGRKLIDESSKYPDFVGFRKFGNSIDDVIESQSLRPRGSGMGSEQTRLEGNWAESGRVNENYPGVFEATMNPRVPGSNIQLQRIPKRSGILGTTKDGDVEIPLTDPGLSFNRRLPFSNRYVSIDKDKLINDEFQLSTFAPNLQSLAEKYAIWSGLGAGAGALGYPQLSDANEKYIINPTVEKYKKLDDRLNKLFGISKKEDGGIIVDDRGQWDHPGKITQVNSNYITMGPDPITGKEIDYDVIGVSNTGDTKLMKPGKNYKFKGKKVTEIPMAKLGINQLDAQPMKKLNQLLNFTNNPDKTNWLDKYQ